MIGLFCFRPACSFQLEISGKTALSRCTVDAGCPPIKTRPFNAFRETNSLNLVLCWESLLCDKNSANQIMAMAAVRRATKPIEHQHAQKDDPTTSSGKVEQEYVYKRRAVNPVAKSKSSDYARAAFSVPERNSAPFLPRLFDFAHLVVHHPVSQGLDCLLSVYIGQATTSFTKQHATAIPTTRFETHVDANTTLAALLIILKVPRRLQLDFDSYRSTDSSLLFIYSYAVCFILFFSELIFEVMARYSRRAENQKQDHRKRTGFFNFVIDLIVCCSLAAEIIAYLNASGHFVNFIGLRVFKTFKYLRAWNQFSDLDMILESVFDSMSMMANIFSALIVTLILYCIIAVQLFSDTFYKVCINVNVQNITAKLNPVQYCDSSSACPKGFDCVESSDNLPFMGTMSFENSWSALILLVQVVLPDNWPPVLNPSHPHQLCTYAC